MNRPSLFTSLLAGILILSPGSWVYGGERLSVGGFVVTRDGKTITFTKSDNRFFRMKYGPEQKDTKIPFSDLAEVVFGEGSKTAVVRLKDGRKIHATYSGSWKGHPEWYTNTLRFRYWDEVAREERESSQLFDNVSRLVVGEHIGRFRRCPHCKAVWPDTYLFCPHDGAKTLWDEPSGAIATPSDLSEAELSDRRANAMEAVLNANLSRAGIDPSSEEATRAKEFGKLWMNPLSDPKDIHQKLDELREEWRKKAQGQ